MPISLPSDSNEPMPYLPIVKAIAPNAPMRRDPHDDADDREQHVRIFSIMSNTERAAAAERVQAEAEQHRDQQHLQDLALGEGIDEGVRE